MSKFHSDLGPHIDHVTISVSSMHATKEFYKDILGLKVYQDDKDKVVLGNQNKPILTLIKSKGTKKNNEGLYHIAFLLSSEKALATWLKANMHRYHMFIGSGHHGVSKAIYLEDPDGNGIEVYADLDPSLWPRKENQIQMETLPLDLNGLLMQADDSIEFNKDIIIGHVHLKVKDISKMYDFYKLIGLETTWQLHSALFTSFSGYHHHLAFNNWNMETAKDHNSDDVDIQSFSFRFPNKKGLDKIIEKLEKRKIPYMTDGNSVELIDPIHLKVRLYFNN